MAISQSSVSRSSHKTKDTKICKRCGKTYPKTGSPLRGKTGRICPECRPAYYEEQYARVVVYTAWYNMLLRCYDPTANGYNAYGGRGIVVCDRWRESFDVYYADVGPRPTPAHSIDRIDNDGDYVPGNVRWADAKTQARNRRSNRWLTYAGKTQTMAAWAEELGVTIWTLSARLRSGKYSEERALSQPFRKKCLRKRKDETAG